MTNTYTIYTDGGSRGNPGPAAAGFIIEGDDIPRVAHGEYIGVATNNVAEYSALLFALKHLRQELGERSFLATIQVYSDSELLVRQMTGEYKIKQDELRKIVAQIREVMMSFSDINFSHIPREKNIEADSMVNKVLDEKEEIK